MERLRRTPFHPQWLLGDFKKTANWVQRDARGLVLDIGCADRWMERHLSRECEYVGVDYPATGGRLYGARPDVFADAASLPFPDASFDTVLLLEVLEHLRDPSGALAEIARVLKPRGQLFLTLPFLYPVHDAPHDYQRYTCHGLLREMAEAGFLVDDLVENLGSAESAGLLFNLALAGMMSKAIEDKRPSLVLFPFVAALVPLVNAASWLLGRALPAWTALTAGYRLKAIRP
ncbi:class I SAM-dependent methyltransferase [Luteimonas salinisoli]|nr:methyltransferase domain-containing protein [Luteimonas salinisoli]